MSRISEDHLQEILNRGHVKLGSRQLPGEKPSAISAPAPDPIKTEKKKPKYNAKRVEIDSKVIGSLLEASYYLKKLEDQKLGLIDFFLTQVKFPLYGGVTLTVDFMTVHLDGRVQWEDTKGFETPSFKDKLKLFIAKYPTQKLELVFERDIEKRFRNMARELWEHQEAERLGKNK